MKNILRKRMKVARRRAETIRIICTMIMFLSAVVAAVSIVFTFLSAFITTVHDMSIICIIMVALFVVSGIVEKYFLIKYHNAKQKYLSYTSC